MEQWEIDLRDKLMKELPDGLYSWGDGDKIWGYTGKGGKIDMEVALHKALKEYIKDGTTEDDI